MRPPSRGPEQGAGRALRATRVEAKPRLRVGWDWDLVTRVEIRPHARESSLRFTPTARSGAPRIPCSTALKEGKQGDATRAARTATPLQRARSVQHSRTDREDAVIEAIAATLRLAADGSDRLAGVNGDPVHHPGKPSREHVAGFGCTGFRLREDEA